MCMYICASCQRVAEEETTPYDGLCVDCWIEKNCLEPVPMPIFERIVLDA